MKVVNKRQIVIKYDLKTISMYGTKGANLRIYSNYFFSKDCGSFLFTTNELILLVTISLYWLLIDFGY